jgi:hypothetical protein
VRLRGTSLTASSARGGRVTVSAPQCRKAFIPPAPAGINPKEEKSMNAINRQELDTVKDADQLPEISQAMLERLERSVAGGYTWCQASWVQNCDAD